jgi:hypothetical protein
MKKNKQISILINLLLYSSFYFFLLSCKSHKPISNNGLREINPSDSIEKIVFLYIDWNYHPTSSLIEEHIRKDIELSHQEYTMNTPELIDSLIYLYSNENYTKRLLKSSMSVYLILDIINKDGKVKTILMSKYFRFDDKEELNFRNGELAYFIARKLPNINALKK